MEAQTLRERKKQQTRTAIADAAHALFEQRGFHAVTVGEIAEAAGVAKQTVFNYFPAKEDLVFDRAEEIEEAMVAALRDRGAGVSAVDAFRAFTRAFWRRVADLPPDRPQASFFALVDATPALQAHQRELGARATALIEAILREEADADPDDLRPRFLAASLCGIHHAVGEIVRARIVAGEAPKSFMEDLVTRADEAYDLLARGAGSYPRSG